MTTGLSPIISVVIVTHNRHPELRDLLGDLAAQELAPHEVIVVDSDQAEDSHPVVREAATQGLLARHVLAPNVIATKRNWGARAAGGELLVILDDDLRVGPEFLAAHASAHHGYDGRVASGPITFPEDWVEASNYYRFKQARHAVNDSEPTAVPPHRFVSMNHSVRRESYMAVGGYDDDYLMYGGEDLDFGHRAKRQGLELVQAPGAGAEHHEVRMTWHTYLNKVHKAAYYGLPLLLAKNPESALVPTMQVIGAGPAEGLRMHALRGSVQLIANRTILKLMAAVFERTDTKSYAFTPRAYLAATLAANSLGFVDHQKGSPYAPLF